MTTFRSEDTLIGIVGLAVLPWIGWIIVRGLRDERLPIGRAYVRRDERAGAFGVLLALYAAAGVLMLLIALDLLFGIDARNWA